MQNNIQIHHLRLSPDQLEVRIDKFLLSKLTDLSITISRSRIQKLIESNCVSNSSNKIINSSSYIVRPNEEIIIDLSKTINQDQQPLKAKNINFEIIYEDQHLAIINKPAGLTTHPGAGNYEDTLVNALLYKFKDSLSNENGSERPGIVHRLDKDTSGLMVIAKNNQTHMLLSKAIQEKAIIRKYMAYIYGVPSPSSGKIERAISRHRFNRLKMTTTKISAKSRPATTIYNTIQTFHGGFASLVECQLLTGRTHQIRVHLESIKHSIIGDQTYNSCKKHPPKDFTDPEKLNFIQNFPRQALHSFYIEFTHPITNESLKFEKEPPKDMQELNSCLL